MRFWICNDTYLAPETCLVKSIDPSCVIAASLCSSKFLSDIAENRGKRYFHNGKQNILGWLSKINCSFVQCDKSKVKKILTPKGLKRHILIKSGQCWFRTFNIRTSTLNWIKKETGTQQLIQFAVGYSLQWFPIKSWIIVALISPSEHSGVSTTRAI